VRTGGHGCHVLHVCPHSQRLYCVEVASTVQRHTNVQHWVSVSSVSTMCLRLVGPHLWGLIFMGAGAQIPSARGHLKRLVGVERLVCVGTAVGMCHTSGVAGAM
jgi:hypothetical protein